MEIERGFANRDVSKKFNVPKNTLSTWKKNREKIVTAFKSSGGTKRQRIKEGTNEQVNLACFNRLLIQRSENIPIHGNIIQEKALEFAKELNLEKFQVAGCTHGKLGKIFCSRKYQENQNQSLLR